MLKSGNQGKIEPGNLPDFYLMHHLFFQASVAFHQPLGQLLDDLAGQRRVIVQQRIKFFPADFRQDRVFAGLYRSRARLTGNNGKLAKISTFPQFGQISSDTFRG